MMMFFNNMVKRGDFLKMIRVLFLCGTMVSTAAYSQDMAHGIVMSSVGTIGNLSNNSMPINFSSKNACINIQNGVAVLIGDRSKGDFVINCKAPVKLNTLGAVLYPNPATTKTTVRFTHKPLFDDDFVLTLWSIEGNPLFSEKVNGSELQLGKVINLGGIASGTYLLTMESNHYTEAIKFIKAN